MVQPHGNFSAVFPMGYEVVKNELFLSNALIQKKFGKGRLMSTSVFLDLGNTAVLYIWQMQVVLNYFMLTKDKNIM